MAQPSPVSVPWHCPRIWACSVWQAPGNWAVPQGHALSSSWPGSLWDCTCCALALHGLFYWEAGPESLHIHHGEWLGRGGAGYECV